MSTINGDRMRQLRLALNVTQTELSQQFGVDSNSLVSRIENGRSAVDDDVARKMAAALQCSVDLLASAPLDILSTKPWLRAYADASIKTVDSVIADNHLALEAMNRLALDRIPETIPRFHGDLNDHAAIEQHAQAVRASAGVDEGSVVRNVMRAAERIGCVILPLSDELGRHLGMSQYLDSVPHIRVSRPRPKVPGDRQRFTVAHEIGHLSLHAHLAPPETSEDARLIEAQAHRFAGAFLTPRDALLEDLHAVDGTGRVTLTALQKLKATWGVAIKMLVVRLRQLDVIGNSQATSLYKQISKRGWNTGEPVYVGHEEPLWFTRALTKEWGASHPEESAAAVIGLDPTYIARWGQWQVPDARDADVLTFDGARKATVSPRFSSSSGHGEVTILRPR